MHCYKSGIFKNESASYLSENIWEIKIEKKKKDNTMEFNEIFFDGCFNYGDLSDGFLQDIHEQGNWYGSGIYGKHSVKN